MRDDVLKPVNVAFRIRREYFDAIVAGTKTREVRALSDYWRKIVAAVIFALAHGGSARAVFVCGKAVHRRRIVALALYDTADLALGRPPSEQGKKDLGPGPVVGFDLGEEMP